MFQLLKFQGLSNLLVLIIFISSLTLTFPSLQLKPINVNHVVDQSSKKDMILSDNCYS